MALIVEFDGEWDPKSKREIEDAVRKCIGAPPEDEKWTVSIAAGFSQSYCEVQVMTPNQTRTRLFFEDPARLANAITDWIKSYPLR